MVRWRGDALPLLLFPLLAEIHSGWISCPPPPLRKIKSSQEKLEVGAAGWEGSLLARSLILVAGGKGSSGPGFQGFEERKGGCRGWEG